MKTVQITISREITVDVEILKYYKGTNDFDDPTEVEAADFGMDAHGVKCQLTDEEIQEAETQFLGNL